MPRQNKPSSELPLAQSASPSAAPTVTHIRETEQRHAEGNAPDASATAVAESAEATESPDEAESPDAPELSTKKRRVPRTRHFTDPKFKTTRQLYDFIEARMREEGRSAPTLAQMGKAVHMSPSGVAKHLDRLEAWGWIQREPNFAREIVLLRRRNQ